MKDIKLVWSAGRAHGLELIFDTLLLALRRVSISYRLRDRFLPPPGDLRQTVRDNAIDLYCFVQLLVLSLLLITTAFGRIADLLIAGYILFEIYLNLLNIVFIGKFRDINAAPSGTKK